MCARWSHSVRDICEGSTVYSMWTELYHNVVVCENNWAYTHNMVYARIINHDYIAFYVVIIWFFCCLLLVAVVFHIGCDASASTLLFLSPWWIFCIFKYNAIRSPNERPLRPRCDTRKRMGKELRTRTRTRQTLAAGTPIFYLYSRQVDSFRILFVPLFLSLWLSRSLYALRWFPFKS